MSRRTIFITAGLVVALAAGGGVAIAGATSLDDDATETPITGRALERASAAALAAVPGRVTATELGDEDSLYEVEVTKPDGSQVDVQLDARFDVVSADGDREDDGQ